MKFLFLFIFCVSISVYSQKDITITGTVKNSLNKPLPYVDILLKKNDSIGQILAFAITDDGGRYKITHQTELNEVLIETSSLTHDKYGKVLNITQNTQKFTVDIILKDRTEALKEVEIKAAARVRVKNDTTTFNLEALTNGSERVAEDILKKLPGVTIEEGGKLKFKGKDVSNVLLDGDNLFDGGYTIGTKNINAKHIKEVEAIENYEDNPMLQGLTQNEKVALNLKFQSGLSLSVNATLGYGYKDRYYVNGTAIAVTRKLKGFSVTTYNNMGNRRSNKHFNAIDHISGIRGLNSQQFSAPGFITNDANLEQARNSIKNNEFFGSLNILPKLSPTETLRLNLDVLSDKAIEESSSTTIINVDPNNPIRIEQSNRNTLKPFYSNARVMFRTFMSKKSSLFTQFKFSKIRKNNEQFGIRNNVEQGENSLFKEHFLSNTTRYTYKVNNNSALKIAGAAAFSEKPESLTLISGIDFTNNMVVPHTTNKQDVYSKKQSLQLQGNYYKRNTNNKFNITLSTDYFKNQLKSDLTDINNMSVYQNDIDYSVWLPTLSADYYLKIKKLELRPKIITKLYNYSYTDNNLQSKQNYTEFLLDASLGLNYEFNKKHSLNTSFTHTNKPPDEKYLYTNFILRSNRLLQNNELNFNKLTANTFSISYHYSDLFRDFNGNIGYVYQRDNNAYLPTNTITQDIQYITYFLQNNGSERRTINAFLDKYISALRTTFRLNSSYTNIDYFNFVNGTNLRANKSETYNTSFGIGTSFIGKFLFGNNLSYSKTNFTIQNSPGYENESIINNFDVTYIPNERFRMDADFNYNIPNIHESTNRTLTLDTSASYENKKKTITYRLEAKNLLDRQNINQIATTDFSTTSNTQLLFERYFLLTVRFRF